MSVLSDLIILNEWAQLLATAMVTELWSDGDVFRVTASYDGVVGDVDKPAAGFC